MTATLKSAVEILRDLYPMDGVDRDPAGSGRRLLSTCTMQEWLLYAATVGPPPKDVRLLVNVSPEELEAVQGKCFSVLVLHDRGGSLDAVAGDEHTDELRGGAEVRRVLNERRRGLA
jgi:hypothetical protein